jgi:hypothetical protein
VLNEGVSQKEAILINEEVLLTERWVRAGSLVSSNASRSVIIEP